MRLPGKKSRIYNWDKTFMGEHIAADLEKKVEGLKRKDGLGHEGKEKDTRTLLEETRPRISLGVKRNLSPKIFRHMLESCLYSYITTKA